MNGQHLRGAASAAVVGALLTFGSCSDSSPAPTPIPTPNPVGGTTIVSLELTAPESIPPGTSAQLTVRATRSDGTSEQLTSGVQWFSNNTQVLQIDALGVATAVAVGEARISVSVNQRSATDTILVLAPGTYRLTGRVTEGGQPISGATVAVTAGTGQGLSSTTNESGTYSLYGVVGSITLHIKRTDYQNLIQNIHVGGNTTHDMSMAFEAPRDPLGGQYRLTIRAAGCSNIASELTQRVYDATIEHRGSRLTVTLSGADFIVTGTRGNRFTGIYDTTGRIGFTLGTSAYYGYYYSVPIEDLIERVSATSALIINGSAITLHDGSGIIAGTMSGTFNITNRTSLPFWPYAATCMSSRHLFELRRR